MRILHSRSAGLRADRTGAIVPCSSRPAEDCPIFRVNENGTVSFDVRRPARKRGISCTASGYRPKNRQSRCCRTVDTLNETCGSRVLSGGCQSGWRFRRSRTVATTRSAGGFDSGGRQRRLVVLQNRRARTGGRQGNRLSLSPSSNAVELTGRESAFRNAGLAAEYWGFASKRRGRKADRPTSKRRA